MIVDSYVEFCERAEPRLRHALCAAFGVQDGRDATAHALAYGWEHWARIRAIGNPTGYLWGVGRNYARRERRRRQRRLALPTPEALGVPWVEPGLAAGLARLSQRERTAVMLIHGLDWSYTEVAEVLGISKSSVQTYAERGIAKLRKEFGVER